MRIAESVETGLGQLRQPSTSTAVSKERTDATPAFEDVFDKTDVRELAVDQTDGEAAGATKKAVIDEKQMMEGERSSRQVSDGTMPGDFTVDWTRQPDARPVDFEGPPDQPETPAAPLADRSTEPKPEFAVMTVGVSGQMSLKPIDDAPPGPAPVSADYSGGDMVPDKPMVEDGRADRAPLDPVLRGTIDRSGGDVRRSPEALALKQKAHQPAHSLDIENRTANVSMADGGLATVTQAVGNKTAFLEEPNSIEKTKASPINLEEPAAPTRIAAAGEGVSDLTESQIKPPEAPQLPSAALPMEQTQLQLVAAPGDTHDESVPGAGAERATVRSEIIASGSTSVPETKDRAFSLLDTATSSVERSSQHSGGTTSKDLVSGPDRPVGGDALINLQPGPDGDRTPALAESPRFTADAEPLVQTNRTSTMTLSDTSEGPAVSDERAIPSGEHVPEPGDADQSASDSKARAPADHLDDPAKSGQPSMETAPRLASFGAGDFEVTSVGAEPVKTAGLDVFSPFAQDTRAPSAGVSGAIALRPDHAPRMAEQIAVAIAANPDGQIELALNPEELGNVRLGLQPSDGGMTVHIVAERFETLDLLRRHADILARELREVGYGDVNFNFGSDTPQHGERKPTPFYDTALLPSSVIAAETATMTPVTTRTASLYNGIDIRL